MYTNAKRPISPAYELLPHVAIGFRGEKKALVVGKLFGDPFGSALRLCVLLIRRVCLGVALD